MIRPVLFVSALALAGCGGARGAPATATASREARGPRAIAIAADLLREGRVRVTAAERRPLVGELVLAGEVVAGESGEADVSVLVEGRVAEVTITEGARVERGQVLAWIEAPVVGRAMAEVIRARSRAQVAARQLARQAALDKEQATSQGALDEARAADESARAELSAARTLLSSVGGSEPGSADGSPLASRIAARAPIAGVVVKRSALVGGQVAPDRPLFRIVSRDHAYVRARLPETAAPLRVGSDARLRPRQAGGPAGPGCPARIAASFGWVDEGRAVPVRVVPVGDCPSLVVGRYVDVLAPTEAPVGTGVVAPREAAIEVRGATIVFVESADGRFVPRPVRLGASTATEVLLESGIAPGERVVTTGAILLKGELLRAELESAS